MATKLTKRITREITVPGVDKPVIIDIEPCGVFASIKGTRTMVAATWAKVISSNGNPVKRA